MLKFKKYLTLLPLVTVISCGHSVDYLVPGNKYNSPIFQENYYRHWDSELKNAKKVETKDVSNTCITSYKYLDKIDPNFVLAGAPSSAEEYGVEYKMSGVDDSFRYGYQSKLFDGQMVCGAQDGHMEYAYQLGRVQIDNKGFSIRFAKESNSLHYFAMQFKATTDNTKRCYIVNTETLNSSDTDLYHSSSVDLTITLYVKTNNGIVGHPYLSTITFNGTTNNGHSYKFYAFDLQEEKLSRLIGVSVQYTVDDDLINWNQYMDETHAEDPEYQKIGNIDYALFLYEMFFPYTSWN